jgi:hypothetical protein
MVLPLMVYTLPSVEGYPEIQDETQVQGTSSCWVVTTYKVHGCAWLDQQRTLRQAQLRTAQRTPAC